LIDFYAGAQSHYLNHLWPLWYALPIEYRGTFWATGNAAPEVQRETPNFKLGTPSNFGPPTVVAGSLDAARVDPRRSLIYVEHGSAQRYLNDPRPQERNALKRCALYLSPRQTNEAKNQVPIGCPKIEPFKGQPHGEAIAVTFHWPSRAIPEADWAWPEYKESVVSLSKRFEVIGHGHPRVFSRLKRFWEANGIEPVESLTEVFQRSKLLIGDNSSVLFEFAALDRPVVLLNSRRYRRGINHGLRFWSHAGIGLQVDQPGELLATVEQALRDENAAERRRLINEVYTGTLDDGVRAMIALEKEWQMANPKAPKYSRVRMEQSFDGPQFPASRLRRIGAPGTMIEQARMRFDALQGIEKEASAAQFDAMTDQELRAEVEGFTQESDPMPNVAESKIPQIMSWVGDNKARAAKALESERTREDRNEGSSRSTLIASLTKIVNG
jgi:hypothetical protein